MDIQKEIYELIVAYLRGELSGEELDRLRGWMAIDEKHRRLVEELRDKKVLRDDVRLFVSFDTEKRWKQLMIEMKQQKVKRRSLSKKLVVYAAAVVVALLVGMVWLLQPKGKEMEIAEVSSVTINHGEAQAVLVLENGNVLPLKGMKDTTILVGERDCVIIDGSGNLKYQLTENSQIPSFHTLKVPRVGSINLCWMMARKCG